MSDSDSESEQIPQNLKRKIILRPSVLNFNKNNHNMATTMNDIDRYANIIPNYDGSIEKLPRFIKGLDKFYRVINTLNLSNIHEYAFAMIESKFINKTEYILTRNNFETWEDMKIYLQTGFRLRRSCLDHICTLRIIFEQAIEKQKTLELNFLDFEKAFDKVNRQMLWKILKLYGTPNNIIKIIRLIYDDYAAKVDINGELTRDIKINSGVRQGCILSPILFLFVIDYIMEKVTDNKSGIPWKFGLNLEDLEFADDICILEEKSSNMKKTLRTD